MIDTLSAHLVRDLKGTVVALQSVGSPPPLDLTPRFPTLRRLSRQQHSRFSYCSKHPTEEANRHRHSVSPNCLYTLYCLHRTTITPYLRVFIHLFFKLLT
jgi:hypothetical protein